MADGDGLAGLRNTLRTIAEERGEYAGIPMPLEGEKLVIHPTYSFAAAMTKEFGVNTAERHAEDEGWTLRNSWYSHAKRCRIFIMEKAGKFDWGLEPAFHHVKHDISTLGCADAWGLEQETRAMTLLRSIVSGRKFRQYVLTGMFLERSKRSGVYYLFRRLKPTVAAKPDKSDDMKVLACLCMHPIAHYAGSWAGAMCPTDDVVAHLQLMRADEAMYWRRCNQHAADHPEAGL